MGKVIGIDLGTTNSCVAIVENGEPVVVPNEEGQRTTPSVVAFTDDGDRLVGPSARRQAVTNPEKTIYAAKRFIGTKFSDEAVAQGKPMVPYEIYEADNGDAWIKVDEEGMPPQQIGAIVLEKMKKIAEEFIGEDITDAIVTVPAYFNDAQRQATKDAGRIAGLNVQRIINEPTAAALAYGLDKQSKETIAVFDLGGGTFDISILVMDNSVFQVKSTNGDTFLGGEDFDNRLIEHLLNEFEDETNLSLRDNKVAMQRVKEAAEKAKHELSTALETDVSLPFIAVGSAGPVHLDVSIERDEFEEMVADLIERLAIPCLASLEDARIKKEDLDAVLLVGGMTRMPRVRKRVEEIFGMPAEDGINPDEVVAIGAAIQGSVLTGEVKDVLLVDVTPLTLGIEVAGGAMEPIINRNTTIPVRKSKRFTTAQDNQDMVRVHIVQGERQMVEDNKSLGFVELHGIPPAPRGIPDIEVIFEINADGILHVTAKDIATNKKQETRILSSSGLSEDEIQEMVQDGERYRADDDRRKQLTDLKNQLDGLIYSTGRNLEEFGDMLSTEDDESIQQALDDAEDALDSTDVNEVQQAYDQLYDTAQLLGSAIYQSAQNKSGDNEDISASLEDEFDDDLLDDFDLDDDTFDDLSED